MNIKNINYTLNAFTLAEVLITLGIIGIVAAMTIPTLIKNSQNAELKTAWKKAYSDISNATNLLIQDNGGDLTGVLDYSSNTLDQFNKYLKFTKTGNFSTTNEVCWSKNDTSENTWEKCAALPNGTLMLFAGYNSSCTGYTTAHPAGVCQIIRIDVNGLKGPNKAGKDIFSVWVEKNKVTPYGIQGDHSNVSSCDSTGGLGCAAKYLME